MRAGQKEQEKDGKLKSGIEEKFSVITCTNSSKEIAKNNEHVVVHGISSKGHFVMSHLADDGSGDRAEGCHATSQADHFKCVH